MRKKIEDNKSKDKISIANDHSLKYNITELNHNNKQNNNNNDNKSILINNAVIN